MASRIFLVEDNAEMRLAYTMLIEEEPAFALCGTASTAREALQAIPAAAPDVVIMDLSLPDMSGIELIRRLNDDQQEQAILIVSGYDDASHVRDAVRAGARGYLSKHEVVDRLLEALHLVLQGEVYISEPLRGRLS